MREFASNMATRPQTPGRGSFGPSWSDVCARLYCEFRLYLPLDRHRGILDEAKEHFLLRRRHHLEVLNIVASLLGCPSPNSIFELAPTRGVIKGGVEFDNLKGQNVSLRSPCDTGEEESSLLETLVQRRRK